jgi:hypothetical protein
MPAAITIDQRLSVAMPFMAMPGGRQTVEFW